MPLFGPSYPLYPHHQHSEIIKILEAVVNSYHDKDILLSLIIDHHHDGDHQCQQNMGLLLVTSVGPNKGGGLRLSR